MKAVSPKEMARIEALAYADGALEEDFMEQAGAGCATFIDHIATQSKLGVDILLLCGKGNNAGDTYVAGIYLMNQGYRVTVMQISPIEECSTLCKINHQRFLEAGGELYDKRPFDSFDILIDGLFGTGFHSSLTPPYDAIVREANASKTPIIAIDIPSGLNGETGTIDGEAIIAEETIFLGLPKLGFFLKQGWNHVGRLRYVNFGLEAKYIDQAEHAFLLLSPEETQLTLPPITRIRHKYQAGSVAGLAGSPSMPGAALLASHAALKGGAGILHLYHPKGMEAELANSPYEVIKISYDPNKSLPIDAINKHAACFIGPGLGPLAKLIIDQLPEITIPTVIDADALTFLSTKLPSLPPSCIFTPHHGEMSCLLGIDTPKSLSLEFISQCQNYTDQHDIILVLKGAPTLIFTPNQTPYINPTGTPGMATAGCGDVLTGLIASLLSQKMPPKDAALLAVYLHGLAGELAAENKTDWSLMASDLIEAFPQAFLMINTNRKINVHD